MPLLLNCAGCCLKTLGHDSLGREDSRRHPLLEVLAWRTPTSLRIWSDCFHNYRSLLSVPVSWRSSKIDDVPTPTEPLERSGEKKQKNPFRGNDLIIYILKRAVSDTVKRRTQLYKVVIRMPRWSEGISLIQEAPPIRPPSTSGLAKSFLGFLRCSFHHVEDRAVVSNLLAIFGSDCSADVFMDLFCLIWSSCLACADSPNRFVSEDQLAEVFRRESERNLRSVRQQHRTVCWFAFFQFLTDAEDRVRPLWESKFNLRLEDFRCLVVVCDDVQRTDDAIFCTCRSNHCGRYLASERSFFLVSAILSSYTDLLVSIAAATLYQMNEWCADDYTAIDFLPFRLRPNLLAKARPSGRVIFIFQFPATIFFLMSYII